GFEGCELACVRPAFLQNALSRSKSPCVPEPGIPATRIGKQGNSVQKCAASLSRARHQGKIAWVEHHHRSTRGVVHQPFRLLCVQEPSASTRVNTPTLLASLPINPSRQGDLSSGVSLPHHIHEPLRAKAAAGSNHVKRFYQTSLALAVVTGNYI